MQLPAPAPVAQAAPPVAARPPAPAVTSPTPAAPVLRSHAADVVTVVIDAGHGGHDPGAIGPNKLREKDITLAVARELAAQINAQRGMRAVLTRSDDRFLELRERTAVAHKHKADLFISIHADAVAKGSARGSSVYALSENGASSEFARLLAARENAAGTPHSLQLRMRNLTRFCSCGSKNSLTLNDGESVIASGSQTSWQSWHLMHKNGSKSILEFLTSELSAPVGQMR